MTKQACYVRTSSVHEHQVGKLDDSNSVHEPLAMQWRSMASVLGFVAGQAMRVYALVAL